MAEVRRPDSGPLAEAWAWYRMQWPGYPMVMPWRAGDWVRFHDEYVRLERSVESAPDRIQQLSEFLVDELLSSPDLVAAWIAKYRAVAADWDVSKGEMPPAYDEKTLRRTRVRAV